MEQAITGIPVYLVKRNENCTMIHYARFFMKGAGEYRIYNGIKYPFTINEYPIYDALYYTKDYDLCEILIREQSFNPTGSVAYTNEKGFQSIYTNYKLVQEVNLMKGDASYFTNKCLLSDTNSLNPKIRKRVED